MNINNNADRAVIDACQIVRQAAQTVSVSQPHRLWVAIAALLDATRDMDAAIHSAAEHGERT